MAQLPAHLKDYVEVKDRLPTFLKQFPDGCVTCEIIGDPDKIFERTPNAVIVKASLWENSDSNRPLAEGFAQEYAEGRMSNSFVEICETSAIGRALANMGIQGNEKRPSREEMMSVDNAKGAFAETTLKLEQCLNELENDPLCQLDAKRLEQGRKLWDTAQNCIATKNEDRKIKQQMERAMDKLTKENLETRSNG